MKEYFKNWNFKKHLTLISVFYGFCYFIDMTLGYVLAKKVFKDLEAKGKLDSKCCKKKICKK